MTVVRRLAATLLVVSAAAAFAAAASTLVISRTLLDRSQFPRAVVGVLHTPAGVALITTIASSRLDATLTGNGVAITPTSDRLIRSGVTRVIADRAADRVLTAAAQAAQTQLLAGSAQGGAITIDLTALRRLLARDIAHSDPRLAVLIARSGDSLGRVRLVTGQEALIARRVTSSVRTLRRVWPVTLIIGLAALLVAVVIAPDRPGLARRAGTLMLLGSVTPLIVGLGVPMIIRRVANPATRAVTAALADRLFAAWWQASLALAASGVVLVAIGVLTRRG